ncbi:MAG: hypothetical protein IH946_02140, partial [Bacteroidetes bacterium]|nr:hypothetical protein [Bacteroidota bacterium]
MNVRAFFYFLPMLSFILNGYSQNTFQRLIGEWNTDVAQDIYITSDSGYVVCGQTFSFEDGESGDLYLCRLDQQGGLLWERT